jgi:hypothetical protein
MKFLVKYANAGLALSILSVVAIIPALSLDKTADPPPTPTPVQTPTPAVQTTTPAGQASTSAGQPVTPAGQASTPAAATAEPTATPQAGAAVNPNEAPMAVAPAKPKSTDPEPPKGMAEAMKLFNARQYALAQKQFEKFINTGVADDATHMNLAYCLYYQKKYTQCLPQFDWVNKYAVHHTGMQMTASHTAEAIRSYMKGLCPSPCMKPFDGRWRPDNKLGPGLWYKYVLPDGVSFKAFDETKKGNLVVMHHGMATDLGACPTCGGTGYVQGLKDGDPPPR